MKVEDLLNSILNDMEAIEEELKHCTSPKLRQSLENEYQDLKMAVEDMSRNFTNELVSYSNQFKVKPERKYR